MMFCSICGKEAITTGGGICVEHYPLTIASNGKILQYTVQAERKKGIKEVVEWLRQYETPTIKDLRLKQYTLCEEDWQVKLKEWQALTKGEK